MTRVRGLACGRGRSARVWAWEIRTNYCAALRRTGT